MNTNTNQTSTPMTRQEMAEQTIDSLNRAMRDIQSLDLKPTENNCILIVDALNAIKEAADIYGKAEESFNELVRQMREQVKRNAELAEKLCPAPDDSICDEAPDNIIELTPMVTEKEGEE